jgi:cellulose biosynthesis protein BcsQ
VLVISLIKAEVVMSLGGLSLRPLTVSVAFISGPKGGTGKSTIVANMASMIDEPVAILDLGFDGNVTASMLHKVEYTDDNTGFIDYVAYGSEFSLLESKEEPNVKLIPPGSFRSLRIPRLMFSIPLEAMANRISNMVALLAKNGLSILLIDLPSNPSFLGPLYPLLVYYSDIVNVVTEPGHVYSSILSELYKWLVKVVDDETVVNVIVNKYHEYFNGYPKEANRYVIRGKVYLVRLDPAAMALTLKGELAVKYKEAFLFRKSLEELTRDIVNQVSMYMGVVR